MKARVLAAIFLTGAIVANLPSATAATTGALTFQPPATLRGNLAGSAVPGSFFAAYAPGTHQTLDLQIDGSFSNVRNISMARQYVQGPDIKVDPPQGSTWNNQPISFGTGVLTCCTSLQNASVVLLLSTSAVFQADSSRLTGAPAGLALISGSHGPSTNTLEPFRSSSYSWPNVGDVAVEQRAVISQCAHLQGTAQGKGSVYIGGSIAQLHNDSSSATVDTRWQNATRPTPGQSVASVVDIAAAGLVADFEGRVTWNFESAFSYAISPAVGITNITSLNAPAAVARLDLPSGPREFRNESLLTIEGRFALDPVRPPMEGQTRMTGNLRGDVSRIAEDWVYVRPANHAVALVIETSAAAALAGITVWWFRRFATAFVAGRWLESIPWIPFSAKLEASELLAHPFRNSVLGFLESRGGLCSVSDVSAWATQEFQMGRFHVYYHLRHLQRGGFVSLTRWNARGHLLVGVSSRAPDFGVQSVQSLLGRSPVAFQVSHALCANPGASQKVLIDAVLAHYQMPGNGRTPSRVAVHKWIRRLCAAPVIKQGMRHSFAGEAVEIRAPIMKRGEGQEARYWPSRHLVAAINAPKPDRAASASLPLLQSSAKAAIPS